MLKIIEESIYFLKTNLFNILLLTIYIELPFVLMGNIDFFTGNSKAIDSWVLLVDLMIIFDRCLR